ncbi:hypothetical protein [Vibrio cholerae]|uniref:hypothetical protein n=1 Tax=Vibrio cholerae TaxID=666 RepID=UPI0002C17B4C|nr:hypothetical protein [Vibrio cholerae]ELI0359977.1 hypothetical protein [Vibrio cholerae]EMQ61085.1 hypothetical protein VCEM1727_003854 [Vibrio cholerae O1 str. EM-1727]KPA02687.1 hypothetical protein AC096_08915 [Vibrio cholerae]
MSDDDRQSVQGGTKKLAIAMQEAALQNINEDLREILLNIERINDDMPAIIKEKVSDIENEISALSRGLKVVPEQFDKDFSKKINRILDVAMEIDLHSKKLRNELVNDAPDVIAKGSSEKIINAIDAYLDERTSGFKTFIIAVTSSIIGGLATGLAVIAYIKIML